MEEINFTAKAIAELEEIKKRPITDIVGEISMSNTALFVQKGLNCSEEEAFKAIELYLEKGGDLISLYLTILEKLQKKGFLPKALNIKQLRAKVENLKI